MDLTRWAVPVLVAALLLATPVPSVAARRIRVTCKDRTLGALVQGRGVRQTSPVCDLDAACDGACSFGFCTVGEFLCSLNPACAGPGNGICAPGVVPADRFVVLARRRVVLDQLGARLVLRCQVQRAPCATTTTISSTPSTTVTTTTLPGGACEKDTDCDDGNPCSADRCLLGSCAHDCLCVGPRGTSTCCPGPAACEQCGTVLCPPGTNCCNPLMGICVPPGYACIH
jgi:hypothetical protein